MFMLTVRFVGVRHLKMVGIHLCLVEFVLYINQKQINGFPCHDSQDDQPFGLPFSNR